MTRQTIVTCECCGLKTEPLKSREISVGIGQNAGPIDNVSFDFCEDCIAKVAGHGVGDNRCFKSIVHQSQQAVRAMFRAEVKNFDQGAADQEVGGS